MHMGNDSLGVVVARFQIARLHVGHRHLLREVASRHERMLVVLGDSGGQRTNRNPLDVATRTAMIKTIYPNAIIRSIVDRVSDASWSTALDEIILSCATDGNATLYGSRDSFIPSYTGRFKTVMLDEVKRVSGTRQRAIMSKTLLASAEFRHGAIYATLNRFPTAYPTVDVAIVRHETREVLLGRKTGETRWRFPGGFVDPTDASLEAAAAREAREEVGDLELGDPIYVGSVPINDTRYRGSVDGVMTSIFVTPYIRGVARAGDDLADVQWVPIDDVEAGIADFHLAVWKRVHQYIARNMLNTINA